MSDKVGLVFVIEPETKEERLWLCQRRRSNCFSWMASYRCALCKQGRLTVASPKLHDKACKVCGAKLKVISESDAKFY